MSAESDQLLSPDFSQGKRLPTIAILRPDPTIYRWISLQEVIPSLVHQYQRQTQNLDTVFFEAASPNLVSDITLIADRQNLIAVVFLACMPILAEKLRRTLPTNIPFLFHIYGDACHGFTSLRGLNLDPFFSHDILICSSSADAKAMKIIYPRSRIRVVPFPSDLPPNFGPRVKPTEFSNFQLRIVYAGRITAQKNLHTLISALAILKINFGLRPALDIYGSSLWGVDRARGIGTIEYKSALDSFAKQSDVNDQIFYHGHVQRNEIVKSLNIGAIFVTASLQPDENFGMAVALALSHGTRCVLSAWGGHRDFKRRFHNQVELVPVRSSKNGPFVSPYEFAAKIAKAFRKSDKSSSLFKNAPISSSSFADDSLDIVTWLKETSPSEKRRLTPSRSLVELRQRGKSICLDGSKSKHLFPNPQDPINLKFARAYGMTKAQKRQKLISKQLISVPWLRIVDGSILVQDPLRGTFKIKTSFDKRTDKIFLYTADGRIKVSNRLALRLMAEGYAWAKTHRWPQVDSSQNRAKL